MTISLSRQVSELWSLLRGLPVQLAFGVTKWNVCRVSTPGTFTSWTSALKMCHSATSFCYRCLIIVKQRFKRSTFVGKRQTKASPSNPSYHNYHIRTAGSYGVPVSHLRDPHWLIHGRVILCCVELTCISADPSPPPWEGWGLSWLYSFPSRTPYILLYQAISELLGYSFFGNIAFLVT